MSGGLRQYLNSVAHKRATEVARKKRLPPSKLGKAIPSEFKTSGLRTAP